MFSDVIEQAREEICRNINPDCCFSEVYDEEKVIELLTVMDYLITLSVLQDPDGKYPMSKEEMNNKSKKRAKKEYFKLMKLNPQTQLKSEIKKKSSQRKIGSKK